MRQRSFKSKNKKTPNGEMEIEAQVGEGNGNPLQCSCLENPRDDRAWWAAVYGVAQSRTRLKQLSSSMVLEARLPRNIKSLIGVSGR